MKKKKVLIVSFNAYPLFSKENQFIQGGAELISYQLAKNLNKELFEVHFVVGNFNQKKKQITEEDVMLHRGTEIKKSGLINGLKNFFKLLFIIKKVNPDVIFSSSVGWITIEIIFIKILLGKKYVFRSSHKRNINGYVDRRSYGWIYRKLINKIDHFILQNFEDIAILKKNYSFKGEVTVIRNFQSIPDKLSPPISERDSILWIGRSEKIKRPELFLDLARRLPKYNFVMIMPNTNLDIYRDIQKKAKKLDNLEIIERVMREDIMSYYKKSKYFVSTSQGEGFPNVLVEAMKYGTPVISFFLDYDNLLKKNNCGLVCNGDINQIASFIENTRDEEWIKMSNNCYSLAKERFNVKNEIKKYEEVFLQL